MNVTQVASGENFHIYRDSPSPQIPAKIRDRIPTGNLVRALKGTQVRLNTGRTRLPLSEAAAFEANERRYSTVSIPDCQT